MLFNADPHISDRPPPSEVLLLRIPWRIYIFLLAATFVMRIIGGDIAGAVLSGLMLCFAVIMIRDGMQEMGRYVVVYGILCILNFVLDAVPLLAAAGGRVSRHVEPVTSRTHDGVVQSTYTLIKKTTPFFSADEGVIYLVQSMAMLSSPVCMLIGSILCIAMHIAYQRSLPSVPDSDAAAAALHSHNGQEAAAAVRWLGGDEAAQQAVAGTQDVGQAPRRDGQMPGRHPSARDSFERFSGKSYKL